MVKVVIILFCLLLCSGSCSRVTVTELYSSDKVVYAVQNANLLDIYQCGTFKDRIKCLGNIEYDNDVLNVRMTGSITAKDDVQSRRAALELLTSISILSEGRLRFSDNKTNNYSAYVVD